MKKIEQTTADLVTEYLMKKQMVEVVLNPSHPVSKELRAVMTVEQLEILQKEIRELEDQGIGLIARLALQEPN